MKTDLKLRRLYISYVVGFLLSLFLTFASFIVVQMQVTSGGEAYSHNFLAAGLVLFAIVQLIVQLVFFIHLGREKKPRLNGMSFLFMVMVVLIIGLGSLWIMNNLNYNMMPHEVDSYIKNEELITEPEPEQRRH